MFIFYEMVKLLSLNVRGLREQKKRRIIFKYARERADIILLQETHSKLVDEQCWQNKWGANIIFNHGDTDARGVCVLLPRGFGGKVRNIKKDAEGRVICMQCIIENVNLTLLNIYAPNKDTPDFYGMITQFLQDSSPYVLMMGDFNLTFNSQLERLNTWKNNDKSKEALLNLIDEFSLCDIWRLRNENIKRYTWFKHNKETTTQASRLDYAFTTSGFDHKIENITYLPGVMTDHSAIFASVSMSESKKGSGYWKLNNSHLTDITFVNYINEEIECNLEVSQSMGASERWEYIKQSVKKACQRWSRRKSSDTKLIISQLMENIDTLESEMPLNERDSKLLMDTRIDLEQLLQKQIQGVIFRSKAKWYEEGGKKYEVFLQSGKSARYV